MIQLGNPFGNIEIKLNWIIMMKLDSNIYKVKTACLLQQWLLPFSLFWSYVPLIIFKTIFAHHIVTLPFECRNETFKQYILG